MAEDYQAIGEKRLAEVAQPINEKIGKSLSSFCQQRGIVLLMEGGALQQTGVVLYASAATDITEEFVKEYNKANPGSGAPAAKKP